MTGVRAIRASGPCDDNGVASFDLVRHQRANESIFLYAFDLIELNGDALRRDPLEVRKATLASIVAKASPGIRFRGHLFPKRSPHNNILRASSMREANLLRWR